MPDTPPHPVHLRPRVAVCADPADDDLQQRAGRLASELNLPLLPGPRRRGVEVLLAVTPARLELRMIGGPANLRGGRPIWVNLTRVDTTSGHGRSLRQPIARAVGLGRGRRRPTVLDATAGYGEDAWLLAGLGCRVLAVERDKVVAALLRDGLARAAAERPDLADRVSMLHTDAGWLLRRMGENPGAIPAGLPEVLQDFWPPDVIYLDPMFPSERKTAERKPLRVLRHLVGADADAAALLQAALGAARRRVVVKRPRHAERLGERPTTTHRGRALRYDVHATGRGRGQPGRTGGS